MFVNVLQSYSKIWWVRILEMLYDVFLMWNIAVQLLDHKCISMVYIEDDDDASQSV